MKYYLAIDIGASSGRHIGGSRSVSAITDNINFLSNYDGNSLSERVENYLLDCGVAQAQINSFKEIMLVRG